MWMRHLLVAFKHFNETPEQCWKRVMVLIYTASPKALEEDKNHPLQGIDQDVVKNFSKGYMLAMAKYKDISIANEKMKNKIKDILMKNLGYGEEELMKETKLLYAETDLLTKGIHIDNTDPITNI